MLRSARGRPEADAHVPVGGCFAEIAFRATPARATRQVASRRVAAPPPTCHSVVLSCSGVWRAGRSVLLGLRLPDAYAGSGACRLGVQCRLGHALGTAGHCPARAVSVVLDEACGRRTHDRPIPTMPLAVAMPGRTTARTICSSSRLPLGDLALDSSLRCMKDNDSASFTELQRLSGGAPRTA